MKYFTAIVVSCLWLNGCSNLVYKDQELEIYGPPYGSDLSLEHLVIKHNEDGTKVIEVKGLQNNESAMAKIITETAISTAIKSVVPVPSP